MSTDSDPAARPTHLPARRPHTRRPFTRLIPALLVVAAVMATVAVIPLTSATAAGPGPIAVTPFAGFNSSLTRAPYVTDLTQTGADVNWATTASTPGTLEWGPLGNCTAHVATVPVQPPRLLPGRGHTDQHHRPGVQRGVRDQRVPVHRGPDRPLAQHHLLLPPAGPRIGRPARIQPVTAVHHPGPGRLLHAAHLRRGRGHRRDPLLVDHRLPQQPQHRPGGHRLPDRLLRGQVRGHRRRRRLLGRHPGQLRRPRKRRFGGQRHLRPLLLATDQGSARLPR